ncbi:hypothetical protein JWG42_07630 [Desulfoprunum benzoelyticum]|uniref:DNA-binding protein n=1 Tax=Desulfoprunum benzoelyticum TaxID=1506996 RepID=A0A840UR54_9BACT|nr:hypothetical protein [Desulfoprunum benzoelyticum]MBB5348707.1 hypothetical protein [Desulfoprunum benzoelyticum]MBM9530015.1 hypothetical protein [Desulfoprunum benzoelyticum]
MTDKPKQRRVRLGNDTEFLGKLIAILEKEKLTKEELAQRLGLDNAKKISDTVLLAAVKLAGDSAFLANLGGKTSGRTKKGAQYAQKKGLVIPAWLFEGKNVADGQRFEVQFGRKGIITLRPQAEENA